MAEKRRLKINLDEAIRRLEITTRGAVTTGLMGNYRSAVRGKGLEFEDYRTYNQGDDASLIDWKASVKANKLLVKEFVEERNLEVFFLVDASSSMITASTPKLKSEYVGEIVASLTYTILHVGDSVGMALFTDSPIREVKEGVGMEQFYIISEALVDPNNYGGGFDLGKAMGYCIQKLKPRTLLIIISDFITLDEKWEAIVRVASEKFDLIGIMVRDPLDEKMPRIPGQVLVEDPYTGRRMIIDPRMVADDYEYEAKREIKGMEKMFKDNNSNFLKLTTTERFVEPVIKMFAERKIR
ncbi:MAG: DUF58 domain-containing protein [archaeon]